MVAVCYFVVTIEAASYTFINWGISSFDQLRVKIS
jgi:hypothetical protein